MKIGVKFLIATDKTNLLLVNEKLKKIFDKCFL